MKKTTTIRIHKSQATRAEALVDRMAGAPEMAALTKPTPTAILRAAIEAGLKAFETGYGDPLEDLFGEDE